MAVITSPVGAALQDILAVAKRRFAGIEILLCPVLVQGEEAPVQIVRTLERLNEIEDVDVVILARGGGSREDLWAFNNEQVARQIAASRAPVVSAIGHEIDNTLADLAADVRAPTPSAAAELVLPDKKQLARELLYCSQRLNEAMRQHLSRYRNALSAMLNQDPWYEPLSQLSERRQALLYAKGRVEQVEARFLTKKRAQLAELKRALSALDPLAVLERGFVTVADYESGHLVPRANQTHIGQILSLKFFDDEITVQVSAVPKGDEDDG